MDNFEQQIRTSAGFNPAEFDRLNAQINAPGVPLPQPGIAQSPRLETSDVARPADMPTGPAPAFSGILPTAFPVTQPFGARNPIERFSNGINYGTDFATPVNTPLKAPQGRWKVVDSFAGETSPGYVGNGTNRGYGNSVLLQNTQTGEQIRFSHLNKNFAQRGAEIQGGQLVGLTGQSGNVTGPHLDVEYYNRGGNISNVLTSPYGYLFGQNNVAS
jgi:murein DD-endopeptidase MepM/ murein hydrolase activator NlpD